MVLQQRIGRRPAIFRSVTRSPRLGGDDEPVSIVYETGCVLISSGFHILLCDLKTLCARGKVNDCRFRLRPKIARPVEGNKLAVFQRTEFGSEALPFRVIKP